jgi:hypothetical protein
MDEQVGQIKKRRKKRVKRPVYVPESPYGKFGVTHFVSIVLMALVLIYVFVEYLSN